MKQLIFLFIFLVSSFGVTDDKPMRVSDIGWLAGNWQGQFNGNNLELHFSGSEGGVILATYKQLSPEGEIRFMRFSSLQEMNGAIRLHLYPFLRPSPDIFVSTEANGDRVVFERVYGSEQCQLDNVLDARSDSVDLQQQCDRFPVKITYERTLDNQYEEIFFGFLPKNGIQTETQFQRTFERK